MPDDLHRVLSDLLAYEHWWRGTNDQTPQAAGVAMRKGQRLLFVRHGERGTWEFPGGHLEEGETPEGAAQREASEETDAPDLGTLRSLWRSEDGPIDYSLFTAEAPEDFRPTLRDGELSDWVWALPEDAPEPLHVGLSDALQTLLAHDEFKETDHPRDDDGKFGSGGGGGSKAPPSGARSMVPLQKGGQTPAHIAALKIPPAWTEVHYNPDPKGALLVSGRDAKGRQTTIYSAEHSAKQAATKFARISELFEKFNDITTRNAEARKDPARRDAADALDLVMKTGMRPGSDRDTGAEHQGYGATTLEGRHVRVSPSGDVKLTFVPGKKHGETISLPVTDAKVARMLIARKEQAGGSGRLFGNLTDAKLRDHVKSLDPGFKTKDFRTRLGTETAMVEMKNVAPPANAKEYKKAVMTIARAVSDKLGNTPAIALASYIAPEVFSDWRVRAGV